MGGEDDKVALRSVEMLDVSTFEWKPLTSLPFAISKHGLVVNGHNEIFMAGGEYPDGSASNRFWKYCPKLDFWMELASMNTSRSELGEFKLFLKYRTVSSLRHYGTHTPFRNLHVFLGAWSCL